MFETASSIILEVIMKSEPVINTKAEHLISTTINICTTQSGTIIVLRHFSIVIIGSPHITNVQGSSFT